MTKIDFGPLKRPKRHGGPGYRRRIEFYTDYVPMAVAQRLARRFTISPGSVGYKKRLMDYLETDWNGFIETRMRFEKETREQAIRGVWKEYYKRYHAKPENVDIEYTQQQFMHDWLGDILESP